MNLSGFIGVIQTAHAQPNADKLPVEAARQDAPRESFEQYVSKAIDEAPKNDRKPENASSAPQKADNEDNKAINAATVSDSKKEKDSEKENTAVQDRITARAEIHQNQPKDKNTGKIVWKIGPDYTSTPELRKLGQIIGQHHAHLCRPPLHR